MNASYLKLSFHDIDNCDGERLRDDFTALRTEYQDHHGHAYDDYRIGIEEAIKTNPKINFLVMLISRKNRWVMIFEVQSAWVPSSPVSDLVNDESPFGSLQFTVSEVENVLLEFDSSKDPGPDGVPTLILKNSASAFALPLCS
jgi:hypothetical protein